MKQKYAKYDNKSIYKSWGLKILVFKNAFEVKRGRT